MSAPPLFCGWDTVLQGYRKYKTVRGLMNRMPVNCYGIAVT